MNRPDPHAAKRLRSAFGALYDTLIAEAPERAAWSTLGPDAIEAAVGRARERVGEAGHALGFRTLLKQELDTACDLAPPVMPFEGSSVGSDRIVRERALREDERHRERERRDQLRKRELRDQAARLLARARDDES